MSDSSTNRGASDTIEPVSTSARLGLFAGSGWAVIGLCLWLFVGCGSFAPVQQTEPEGFRSLSARPLDVRAEGRRAPHGTALKLTLEDRRWHEGNIPPLVLDHGKWVHMFLIREPELDAFAHVHPQPVDRNTFDVSLPPLPPGEYRVYVDLRHEGDLTHTAETTISIPTPPPAKPEGRPSPEPDPDDSWGVTDGVGSDIYKFADGHFMIWDGEVSLVAGRMVPLRFFLLSPDGKPAEITPYMGMLSHAVVRDRDATIFGHLHAMEKMDMGEMDMGEMPEMDGGPMEPPQPTGASVESVMPMGHQHDGLTSFPSIGLVAMGFVFPKPGTYRVWAQIKSGETVYTGAFDLKALPDTASLSGIRQPVSSETP